MSLGRRARRERISVAFDAFHTAMGAVLGSAARLTDTAAQEHALTMVELWLRHDGLEAALADPGLQEVLANPRLGAAVARVAADRDAAIEEWLTPHGPDGSGPAPRRPDGGVRARARRRRRRLAPGVRDLQHDREHRAGAAAVADRHRVVGAGTFPVGVPLLDESHLQIDPLSRKARNEAERVARRSAAESLVETLLLRVVGYFRPGLVQVHTWDVGHLTGSLPGLYPLTRTGLLTVHDPGGLEALLEELSDRIRRVHARALVGGHPSLKALAAQTGDRSEPWVVAVLVGDGSPLAEADQVQRVLRGGLAAGISVIMVDIPMTIGAPLETVRMKTADTADGAVTVATTSMTGDHVTVIPDPVLPRTAVTDACHAIAREHERWRSRIATFTELLPPPEKRGEEDSRTGLCAPIGFVEGVPRAMMLADASPHALIGGPSGSGKTNLLLTMICSLATRYPPEELEFYLLDFKEGVSFAQFAPRLRNRRWLPHARLVGVNINTDREFGLALLQHLAAEMRHRAEVAKQNEVAKLEELRAAGVPGPWPRIVAVIDEFQFLFGEKDSVTNQAVQLLEDLARRGRSQGIHLVLASQDVSGIQAFWMRPAIFEQFVLRIGLPRARRVLTDTNDATMHLPRWHAVVNHESGVPHGNERLRMPEATKEAVDAVLEQLHGRYAGGRPEPRLFDGSRAPLVSTLTGGLSPATDPPEALIGQRIDVAGSAATVALPDVPGRNVGVLGAGGTDAMRVLAAAALSLAKQHDRGGKTHFVLAPLIPEAVAHAAALEGQLFGHSCTTVPLKGLAEWVTAMSTEIVDRLSSTDRPPTYVVLYGGDAADAVLERAQQEALRKVLRFGPEVGVHIVGWWRSLERLRALLTVPAARTTSAAGSHSTSRAPSWARSPGLLLGWSPRPGRGLLFDRVRHARPVAVIVPSPDDVAERADPVDAHAHPRPA